MARPKKQADDSINKAPVGMVAPLNMMPPVSNQPGGMPPQQPVGVPMGGTHPHMQQQQQQHPRVVDNESFLRVRDSAVGRLNTILELLRSFTADYVRQTNLLLGEHTAEGVTNDLMSNFEAAAGQLLMPMPEMAPPAEEKKERKKRTHDPNAPKRPLTPYFLYMQHARSIIANDLGSEAPKGAVQGEGQRRWANMGPHEKQGWNNAYQYNLRLYQARVHSYKHGNPLAKDMSDDEALKYAEEFNVPMPELKDATSGNDQDAIAQQLQQVAQAPVPGMPDDGTPKKGGPGRKRKTDTPGGVDHHDASKMPPSSPDKKRRRTSGKIPEEEPKKGRGKKTKSG